MNTFLCVWKVHNLMQPARESLSGEQFGEPLKGPWPLPWKSLGDLSKENNQRWRPHLKYRSFHGDAKGRNSFSLQQYGVIVWMVEAMEPIKDCFSEKLSNRGPCSQEYVVYELKQAGECLCFTNNEMTAPQLQLPPACLLNCEKFLRKN